MITETNLINRIGIRAIRDMIVTEKIKTGLSVLATTVEAGNGKIPVATGIQVAVTTRIGTGKMIPTLMNRARELTKETMTHTGEKITGRMIGMRKTKTGITTGIWEVKAMDQVTGTMDQIIGTTRIGASGTGGIKQPTRYLPGLETKMQSVAGEWIS